MKPDWDKLAGEYADSQKVLITLWGERNEARSAKGGASAPNQAAQGGHSEV